jgi:type I restriction enzyme, S subunit
MSEWRECKLGDVITFQRGHDLTVAQIKEGIYPVAGSNGIIGYHNAFTTEANGITIGRSGHSIGVPHFYKNNYWAHNTALYIKDFKGNFQKFIYYLLKTIDFSSLNTGSAVPSLNRNHVHELDINIPSVKEQKAIAAVLSNLDDKIDLLHRQNKTLEAMAETLFKQWFVVEAREDWEEKPLKDVCSINNGYAFKSPTYTEKGQKIIRTMNFSNHWIELNNLVYISEELAKELEKYYLQRNDFLLVMVGASLGNFAIVTKDVLPSLQNQNMWCFRAKDNIQQHYLNFVLRQLINETLHSASGSAREFFQKGVFYELQIIVPPFNFMEKFENYVEKLFSKIELNRFQIQTLETLRDKLLPKLMSGEIRVNL